MNKRQDRIARNKDLARLFKDDFKDYRDAKDEANAARKEWATKQNWNNYQQQLDALDDDYKEYQEKANKIQYKIIDKLPLPKEEAEKDFQSINNWYIELSRNGTIDDPITHPFILDHINKKKEKDPNSPGRIRPEGSRVVYHKTGAIYTISGFEKRADKETGEEERYVTLKDESGKEYLYPIRLFQYKIKNKVISYMEEDNMKNESWDPVLGFGYFASKDPAKLQAAVDDAIKKFGRVGAGMLDDLDSAGYYLDSDNKVQPKVNEKSMKEDFEGIDYNKLAIVNKYYRNHSVRQFIDSLVDIADNIGELKALNTIIYSLAERIEYLDEPVDEEFDALKESFSKTAYDLNTINMLQLKIPEEVVKQKEEMLDCKNFSDEVVDAKPDDKLKELDKMELEDESVTKKQEIHKSEVKELDPSKKEN